MYSILYFSPTGNAFYLAKKLKSHLGDDSIDILPLEFSKIEELKKNKHLIVLYPVHGFNAARTVKRFIKNLPGQLYDDVSLIGVGCTTSWLNHGVSHDLRKPLIKKGYSIVVDEILSMPLTFIMAFPDEVARRLIDESEAKMKDIASSIIDRKISDNDVKIKSKVINSVGKIEQGAARLFGLELHANKNCTSCGICWRNCPEGNIKSKKKNKPKFGVNCLMCMRCIYNCPEKAISPRFSKFIPIKKGYSILSFVE